MFSDGLGSDMYVSGTPPIIIVSAIGISIVISWVLLDNADNTFTLQFTFINISALRTLPDDQFRNGMSEVVKYGFIYDYEFIDYLLENDLNHKYIINSIIE